MSSSGTHPPAGSPTSTVAQVRTVPVWAALLLAGVTGTLAWYVAPSRPRPTQILTESRTLGIEDLVQRLRSELETMEQHRMSRADSALFQLKDFDLELSFVVRSSQKEAGKLEYSVVTVEMERELGAERTNKITLHMALAPPESAHLNAPTERLSAEGAIRLPTLTKGSSK